eukprot:TRINITY_DN3415_c0_g1_i1.p1 TRINITY_DN3415_c0_g1~~TRINITY_DN3415_c0_g1_i1.p1  ORF type:complete len:754 (+),score=141.18 TRINITY_DN3415_c0_g1_i1:252-2513(+)
MLQAREVISKRTTKQITSSIVLKSHRLDNDATRTNSDEYNGRIQHQQSAIVKEAIDVINRSKDNEVRVSGTKDGAMKDNRGIDLDNPCTGFECQYRGCPAVSHVTLEYGTELELCNGTNKRKRREEENEPEKEMAGAGNAKRLHRLNRYAEMLIAVRLPLAYEPIIHGVNLPETLGKYKEGNTIFQLTLTPFPSELLFHVFSFLSFQSLLRCRKVSKQWREIIDIPSMWKLQHKKVFGWDALVYEINVMNETIIENYLDQFKADYRELSKAFPLPLKIVHDGRSFEELAKDLGERLNYACKRGYASLADRYLRKADKIQAIRNFKGQNLKQTIVNKWYQQTFPELRYEASPLFNASLNGYESLVAVLIKHGADVNGASPTHKSTPIYAAAFSGHHRIVRMLANAKADMNAIRALDGSTPFWIAVRKGHYEAAKTLVELGANLECIKSDGIDAPYAAVKMGYVKIMELILQHMKLDLNALVVGGSTLFYVAAYEKHLDMMKFLWKKGANPDVRNEDGTTATYIAAYYGDVSMLKFLKEIGADFNIQRNDKMAPLAVAMQEKRVEAVRFMLSHPDIDLSILRSDGANFSYIAARSGNTEILKMTWETMKQRGMEIDIDYARNDGVTALNAVAQNGYLEVAKILLERKANPNKCSRNKVSPLLIAAQEGHLEMVKLLLAHGANIHHAVDGATALFIAAQQGHKDIVVVLIESGADVNAVRNNGVSVMMVAKAKSHSEIVDYLKDKGAISTPAVAVN